MIGVEGFLSLFNYELKKTKKFDIYFNQFTFFSVQYDFNEHSKRLHTFNVQFALKQKNTGRSQTSSDIEIQNCLLIYITDI